MDATLNESLAAVIEGNAERVRAWLANEPGVWGYLAGQAVLAERRRLGRSLSERERRIVWQALWDALTALRAHQERAERFHRSRRGSG